MTPTCSNCGAVLDPGGSEPLLRVVCPNCGTVGQFTAPMPFKLMFETQMGANVELGPDWIEVQGASGTARPDRLKVSVGYSDGFVGEGQIAYAGPGCLSRARRA